MVRRKMLTVEPSFQMHRCIEFFIGMIISLQNTVEYFHEIVFIKKAIPIKIYETGVDHNIKPYIYLGILYFRISSIIMNSM